MAEDPRIFLHFKTLEKFQEKLNDGTINPNKHFVVIKDEGLIWVKGKVYSNGNRLENLESYYNDWEIIPGNDKDGNVNKDKIRIILKGKEWSEDENGKGSWVEKNKSLELTTATQNIAGLMSTKDKKAVDNLIKLSSFSHIDDNEPFTPSEDKVLFNYNCRSVDKDTSSENTQHNPEFPVANDTQAGIITAEEHKLLNTDIPEAISKELKDREEAIKELSENKVDIEDGKGLSSNDFTDVEKNKLEGITNYVIDIGKNQDNNDLISIIYTTYNANSTQTKGHTININSATQTAAGLMSASDKTKLDKIVNIESINTNPNYNETGITIPVNVNNINTETNSTKQITIGGATSTKAGMFVASDKRKLDGIETNAQVNVQPDWDEENKNSDAYIKNKPESLPANGGNSATVNNHSVNSDVPANAKFTDTTYTVGSGDSNGQIKVTPSSGSAYNVNVTGLKSAAYTESSAYATSAQGTKADNAVPNTRTINGRTLSSDITISASDVGLGNVTNLSKTTMFTSPAFTGTPTAPTAAAGTNTTQIATTAYVKTEINNVLAASDAMLYKGTLGTGGTITSLPNTHSKGDTYKIITAGTYAGVKCEVGDMIICLNDGTAAKNDDWTVILTNIDGAVTGPSSAVGDRVATFNGTTGKVIKDSGFTIATSVPANAKFTDTTYDIANTSTAGLVKSSITGTTVNRNYNVEVNSDGTMKVNVPWTDNNTTYSVVTKAANGLCPKLPNETTTDKFLRLDGTWVIPTKANQLSTSRTLWGQSFNGSANISGSISGVGTMSFNSNSSIGLHSNYDVCPTNLYALFLVCVSSDAYTNTNDVKKTEDDQNHTLIRSGYITLKRLNWNGSIGRNPTVIYITKAENSSGIEQLYLWEQGIIYNNLHCFRFHTDDPQGFFRFEKPLNIDSPLKALDTNVKLLDVEGENDFNYDYRSIISSTNLSIPTSERDYRWLLYHGGKDSELRGLELWSYDGDKKVFNRVAGFSSHNGNKFKVYGDIYASTYCRLTYNTTDGAYISNAHVNTFTSKIGISEDGMCYVSDDTTGQKYEIWHKGNDKELTANKLGFYNSTKESDTIQNLNNPSVDGFGLTIDRYYKEAINRPEIVLQNNDNVVINVFPGKYSTNGLYGFLLSHSGANKGSLCYRNWQAGTPQEWKLLLAYGTYFEAPSLEHCTSSVRNANNYPYHRILTLDVTVLWYDIQGVFMINLCYNGGGYGIFRIALRTNTESEKSLYSIEWILNKGLPNDCIQIGFNDTTGNTYLDVFYKSKATYDSVNIIQLLRGGRSNAELSFTLVNSSEVDNTTTSDKKTSYEVYKTLTNGCVASGRNYSSISTSELPYAELNINAKGYAKTSDIPETYKLNTYNLYNLVSNNKHSDSLSISLTTSNFNEIIKSGKIIVPILINNVGSILNLELPLVRSRSLSSNQNELYFEKLLYFNNTYYNISFTIIYIIMGLSATNPAGTLNISDAEI